MKIVNIIGGLGNQMFQYAFAVALQHRYVNELVYVDIQHYNSLFFNKHNGANLHNGYEINKIFPNATLPIASPSIIAKISYWIPNYVLSRIGRKMLPARRTEYISPIINHYAYEEQVFDRIGDCYYEGYWQSIKYYLDIKTELYYTFQHPEPNDYNTALIKEIEATNSVGIHIRRGDYLEDPEFCGICEIDYYEKAVQTIISDGKEHTFYLFSNDICWCKNNIIQLFEGYSIKFVTDNIGVNSCWDLFLMTHCKELIIANSSFSWWAAFLNKRGGRIIAPRPWLNRECTFDIYESSWLTIETKRS